MNIGDHWQDDERLKKMPPIFPCGCSRNKVRAGLCDLYDTDGVAISRKDPNRGDIYAGDTRLLNESRHRPCEGCPTAALCERDGCYAKPLKNRSNAPGWFQAATRGTMREMTEADIQAAIRAPVRLKPEPPPNRMERLTIFGVKRWNQGDQEPPGTMAAAFAELGDRWQAFKAEVLGAMAADLDSIQWWGMRLFRRIYWRRATGSWPVLCSNPACITVLDAGTHCDRHAAEVTGVKVRTLDIRVTPDCQPQTIRLEVDADRTVTISAVGWEAKPVHAWIVGRFIERNERGPIWEYQGFRYFEVDAVALCQDRTWFVAPVSVGDAPVTVATWPGLYYPLASMKG